MAKKGPYLVRMEPGTYYWCACGLSGNQPFCDNSHEGTEFSPVKFVMREEGYKSLCGCKRTRNRPFCDGTHQTF